MRERLIGGWEWFYKKERGGSALVTWRSWRAMQAALVAILYLVTTIAEAQVYETRQGTCVKLRLKGVSFKNMN